MAEAEFSLKMDGGIAILGVGGSIDAHSTPQFDKEMKSILTKSKKIILDMLKVDYIATAGLGVLIASFNEAKAAGGNIVIANMPDKIKHVFDTMGFSKVISVAPSLDQAKSMLK
jgi:anti-sigma B factor antagonist